jgi:uroporphyrinogen decarboxylase
MTSAERVHTALRNRQPDRVPIIEPLIDMKVCRALIPDCRDMADCMDRLGLDAVCCGATFKKVKENSDGSYVDEWGCVYKPGPEAMDHPVAGPIAMLAEARAYQPPDPDAPHRLAVLREIVQRYKGKRSITFHYRAAFMWSAYLLGLDNLLMNFLDQPNLVALVMDKVLEVNIQVVRHAIKAGAEVITMGDDYAHNDGPMMSPAVFRQFILPRLKRMIDVIHQEGALCIKHTDGNINQLLEMLVEAGPDAINPLEPVAGMALKRVKQLVGNRVCLIGNIDCGHLLSMGTPAEVRQAVRQAIADAGTGGGYILSSSNSIHSSCKPENYQAMIDACREFGEYGVQC